MWATTAIAVKTRKPVTKILWNSLASFSVSPESELCLSSAIQPPSKKNGHLAIATLTRATGVTVTAAAATNANPIGHPGWFSDDTDQCRAPMSDDSGR
jgi:hypothetical protein